MTDHMRLAVSNIAWGSENLVEYLRLLKQLGCSGVEIAPSLNWPEPISASPTERQLLRTIVSDHGLEVVGLHSLLYTRPDLALFADDLVRVDTLRYLGGLSRLCQDLGGKTLVFGSPRNRQRGSLSVAEVFKWAADFFWEAAEAAKAHDVFLLIEPLGPDETDFITSSQEGLNLLTQVNHPNFQLHLDAKALIASGEDFLSAFISCRDQFMHFHVGDPGLAPPGSTGVDHAPIGRALRAIGYDGYISIEMRRDFGPPAGVIERSVAYVRRCYLGNEHEG